MSKVRSAQAGLCVRADSEEFAEDKGNDRQEAIRKSCYSCQRIREWRRREGHRKGSEKRACVRWNVEEQRHRASGRPQSKNKKLAGQTRVRR